MNTNETLKRNDLGRAGKTPLFSIIIPAYNVEKYLQGVVDSVLNQTFDDYEIIIVDDGSQKPCHDLCDEIEKTDSRIKVIHKENGGVSTARNAGIRAAKGEYIHFLDGDDRLVENVLQKVCYLIGEECPDVIASTVHYYTNWEKSYVREEKLNVEKNMDFDDLIFTLGNNPYLAHNFYRRDFVIKNGVFFDNRFYSGQDKIWKLTCMSRIQSAKVCEGAFYYHFEGRPGSIRNKFKAEKTARLFLSEINLNKTMFEMSDSWTSDKNKYRSKKITSGCFWRAAALLVINVKNEEILSKGLKLFDDNIYIIEGEWCTIHKLVFLRKFIGTKNFLRLIDYMSKRKNNT